MENIATALPKFFLIPLGRKAGIAARAGLLLMLLAALSWSATAAAPDGDDPRLFVKASDTKAPLVLSRTAFAASVADAESGTCQECGFGSDDADKVSQLTLQYNGFGNVNVKVYNNNDVNSGQLVFDGTVGSGDTFTFFASTIGNDKFSSKIGIYIDDVEHFELHTSCSKPLGPGTLAGNFEVTAGKDKQGDDLCAIPPPPSCLECGFGDDDANKVRELTLEYDGPSGVTVEIYNDKNDNGTPKTFNNVQDGDLLTINSLTDFGDDKFSSSISFWINGSKDTELHTSCSLELGPGTVAGNFEVTAGKDKDGVPLCPSSSTPPPFNGTCFVVADSQNDLLRLDKVTGVEQLIGDTGVGNVEAIALSPSGGTLYASNAGTFGTLSTSSGSFNSIGSYGTGGGSAGNITFSDVDGLAFDPTTGVLYGSHRRSSDDVLFQINPSTGAHVPNAFGAGIDYVVVPGIGSRDNIDDLAIHPSNGTMYAILNNSGEDDLLITINKSTGASSSQGSLGVDDMEGLTFDSNGNLFGVTGDENSSSTDNKLWSISLGGSATLISALDKDDYEALACPTGGVTGTVDLMCVPGPGAASGDYGYTNMTTGQVCDPNDLPACDPAKAGEVLRYRLAFRNEATSTIAATGLTFKVYFPGDVDGDGDVDLKYDAVSTGAFCGSPFLCPSGFSDPTPGTWGGQVTFNLSSLAVGDDVDIELYLKVQASPPNTRTERNLFAEVFSMDQGDVDSTPGNMGNNPPALTGDDDECGLISVLPVEMVSFEAQLDGQAAELRWETASETNNAGFEVQHRYDGDGSSQFESLGFVEGAGTTLEVQTYTFRVDDLAPGRHVFRLKQLDYDGTFEYSPQIEVSVGMPESFLVSKVYPNPFNPEASLSFGVKQEQEVRVELFNMLGQRVKVLFQGRPAAGTTKTIRIDGSDLRSGMYIVRVQGERFADTQMITLIK